MSKKESLLTIIGPTAIGKTSVAIAVAKRVNGEIIGLDSRQIYIGMDIGTAQPSIEELKKIPHHLISFRNPNEIISAGEYARLVNKKIQEIRVNRNEPIICGGAGLYLEAFTRGIFEGSAANLEIRNRLDKEYDNDPTALIERLMEIDPVYAQNVHPNNRKRLVRALEIYEITDKPPSEHFADQSIEQSNKLCTILLSLEMEKLENRIRKRTQKMLKDGWIEETKELLKKYSVEKAHALDSIGYRQINQYLKDEYTLEELEDEIVLRTRQFAKRQMTWFRNRLNAIELKIEQFVNEDEIAYEILDIWNKYDHHSDFHRSQQ